MIEREDKLVKVFYGVKTLEYDLALHEDNRGVSATSEAWSILQGVSPCRVRPNQPPVSSVAFVAEHRERKCFPVREKLFIFSINERTKQTKRTQRIV